jgi:hypothetical protein
MICILFDSTHCDPDAVLTIVHHSYLLYYVGLIF